ncbi:hypothetical protein OXX69_001734 [Metschnikowia pulcherrima]
MYMHASQERSTVAYGECPTPEELRASDYFSASPMRSVKRAKSVRDAFPPSPPITPSLSSKARRQSYFHSKQLIRSKSDERMGPSHKLNLSLDSSDSESLPDLSDCNSSTESIHSAITPTKSLVATPFSFNLASPVRSPSIALNSLKSLSGPQVPVSSPSIFEIPELVYKIVEYADYQNTNIPREAPPIRRKPLSLQHAMLLHDGDVEKARMAMKSSSNIACEKSSTNGVLHTCLLINKLFNRVAKEVIGDKIIFRSDEKFSLFAKDSCNIAGPSKPQTLVLNKLFHARQASLDRIADAFDYSSLKMLEIFMCPKLKPSTSFMHASLKSFIVAGSKVLDDSALVSVAGRCPNLEVLDVRACEEVSDYGIYSIATRCHKLRSINIGRKRKGHLITDHSVSMLAKNNPYLHTIGLAGCHITDRTIWQLAMSCGKRIERLSLNNCLFVTDQSIPIVLSHNLMPILSVLEIRFIEKLTKFDPIVTFRRRQNARGINVLIETCEVLLQRLKSCEKRMDQKISQRIFCDISEWANNSADEDLSHEELLRTRRMGARKNPIIS